MLATALQHFREDIARARSIVAHADSLPRSSCSARTQPLDKGGTVLKVIQDIEYLVFRCDNHINVEFRQFLSGIGCSPATIGQAGY
ncbi:MAG: hypothetical protein NVSMB9_21980 [Isosphaeraceae bacterium]